MVGIVHPECLNMDSRTGKVYPIYMQDDPHTGIEIPVSQIGDSRMEKLIFLARQDNPARESSILCLCNTIPMRGK